MSYHSRVTDTFTPITVTVHYDQIMTDFENTFEWKMIKESDKTYFMNEHGQQDY
jgi:hypothetical protein